MAAYLAALPRRAGSTTHASSPPQPSFPPFSPTHRPNPSRVPRPTTRAGPPPHDPLRRGKADLLQATTPNRPPPHPSPPVHPPLRPPPLQRRHIQPPPLPRRIHFLRRIDPPAPGPD